MSLVRSKPHLNPTTEVVAINVTLVSVIVSGEHDPSEHEELVTRKVVVAEKTLLLLRDL